MAKDTMKIGIALSGGGMRAAVFHLGVLGRLASEGLFEKVTCLSTVSGGSLGIGLVYSLAGGRWPTSDEFIKSICPQARHCLTRTNIQWNIILRLLTRPWLIAQGRAKLASESLQHCWQVTAFLKDISKEPRWIINATAYESGKNWRFTPQRMGDYILNHVLDPTILLADAIAASAAYPGLIGPLVLKTSNFQWSKFVDGSGKKTEVVEPEVKHIHLWDGGVYDNLGMEALFKPSGKKFRNEYNFLIVSDASKGIKVEKPSLLHRRALRLVNIATDQVRSLRARSIVNYFIEQPNSGVYLKIGNTARYILEQANIPEEEISNLAKSCLCEGDVNIATNLATTLRRVSEEEFDRIYRHGWEVTNCTLQSRCPSLFNPLENVKDLMPESSLN